MESFSLAAAARTKQARRHGDMSEESLFLKVNKSVTSSFAFSSQGFLLVGPRRGCSKQHRSHKTVPIFVRQKDKLEQVCHRSICVCFSLLPRLCFGAAWGSLAQALTGRACAGGWFTTTAHDSRRTRRSTRQSRVLRVTVPQRNRLTFFVCLFIFGWVGLFWMFACKWPTRHANDSGTQWKRDGLSELGLDFWPNRHERILKTYRNAAPAPHSQMHHSKQNRNAVSFIFFLYYFLRMQVMRRPHWKERKHFYEDVFSSFSLFFIYLFLCFKKNKIKFCSFSQ